MLIEFQNKINSKNKNLENFKTKLTQRIKFGQYGPGDVTYNVSLKKYNDF